MEVLLLAELPTDLAADRVLSAGAGVELPPHLSDSRHRLAVAVVQATDLKPVAVLRRHLSEVAMQQADSAAVLQLHQLSAEEEVSMLAAAARQLSALVAGEGLMPAAVGRRLSTLAVEEEVSAPAAARRLSAPAAVEEVSTLATAVRRLSAVVEPWVHLRVLSAVQPLLQPVGPPRGDFGGNRQGARRENESATLEVQAKTRRLRHRLQN